MRPDPANRETPVGGKRSQFTIEDRIPGAHNRRGSKQICAVLRDPREETHA
jgi:hypothetical protein